jgi:hypothetical protein
LRFFKLSLSSLSQNPLHSIKLDSTSRKTKRFANLTITWIPHGTPIADFAGHVEAMSPSILVEEAFVKILSNGRGQLIVNCLAHLWTLGSVLKKSLTF